MVYNDPRYALLLARVPMHHLAAVRGSLHTRVPVDMSR